MFDQIISFMHNPRLISMTLAAVAAIATVMTLAMPLLSPDALPRRMKLS